ncbi:MAG: 2-iminobutanoate/2-iminopropanoate deaminase [Gaiellales bacterium]|jgi:2-iminobutanoate/2-iminopropanoate deaminase|nr:2-iminobutanoate/2-iminopropanoate deaminase [Gaiellales bacterium]MDX6565564.1 2-iminobutanoate/2-iminopropanoate deaminase [Gaiellales bacterium]
MQSRQAVHTEKAPAPLGGAPYSQAIISGDLVFASGQVPLDPATGALVDGGVSEQTEQVLRNVQFVLEEAGSGLDRVLKTTVFLTDLGSFGAMNEVYARHFTAPYPARSTIEVSALPAGAAVEIECTAVRG